MPSREELNGLALRAVRSNLTSNFEVIAAPNGPGNPHKEYLHIWPRDSLLVAIELSNHDQKTAEKIVKSVLNLPTSNGLFFQRYDLNGKPDENAWCNGDGNRQLDQDALRFVALSLFPSLKMDKNTIFKSYNSLLDQIVAKNTVTDVWEQKRGYFFYSTAALIWGLKSAEKIIPGSSKIHREILTELVESIETFYDNERESFVKSPSDKTMDLEVLLAIMILSQCQIEELKSSKHLKRILSTLRNLVSELCVTVNGKKIPMRYRQDFWNGEIVGTEGIGRPWPMGVAFISQVYSFAANLALELGEFEMAEYSHKMSNSWADQLTGIPHIHQFPEQIDKDGTLPESAPRPLTWCATEILKSYRLNEATGKKIRENSNLAMLSSLYRPKLLINSSIN